MIRHAAALAIAGLLPLAACTHRVTLARDAPEAVLRDVNRTLSGREAEVLLEGGQLFRWIDVQLSPDRTTGVPVPGAALDEGVRGRPAVATDRVAMITTRSRSRGALEGAGIGGLVGAVMGLALPPDPQPTARSRAAASVFYAVGGALWGVVIGLVRSSRTRILIR